MKFWKNWPYWVRGSVIGLLIGLLIGVINIFMAPVVLDGAFGPDYLFGSRLLFLLALFLLLPIMPVTLLLEWLGIHNLVTFAIFYPMSTILTGALIGYIYGKIKNRNKISY